MNFGLFLLFIYFFTHKPLLHPSRRRHYLSTRRAWRQGSFAYSLPTARARRRSRSTRTTRKIRREASAWHATCRRLRPRSGTSKYAHTQMPDSESLHLVPHGSVDGLGARSAPAMARAVAVAARVVFGWIRHCFPDRLSISFPCMPCDRAVARGVALRICMP